MLAYVETFDAKAAASGYSNLAAVLAGFAFAAILLILTRDSTRHGLENPLGEKVLPALLVAFVSFIVTTQLYIVLMGESSHVRMGAQELLAGIALVLSMVVLLYGLLLLLQTQHEWTVARSVYVVTKNMLLLPVPLLIFYFVGLGSFDSVASAKFDKVAPAYFTATFWGLFVLLVAHGAIWYAWPNLIKPRSNKGSSGRSTVAKATLLLVVAAAGGEGWVTTFVKTTGLPTPVILGIVCLLAVYLLVMQLHLASMFARQNLGKAGARGPTLGIAPTNEASCR